MPSDGTIGYLVGKLDVLRIECPTCGRQGRYHVARLLEELGPGYHHNLHLTGYLRRTTRRYQPRISTPHRTRRHLTQCGIAWAQTLIAVFIASLAACLSLICRSLRSPRGWHGVLNVFASAMTNWPHLPSAIPRLAAS
jgi:hypothetical protein